MRWIFGLLLLANMIAWYWFSAQFEHQSELNSTADEKAQLINDSIPRLVLLSELQAVDLPESEPEHKKIETVLAEEAPAAEEGNRWIDEASLDESPSQDAPPEASTPAQAMCAYIGPFNQKPIVEDIAAELESLGMASSVDVSEVVVRNDYWVIIPPLASEVAAKAFLSELKQKNIDSFLITEDEHQNGISLGVFGNRDNAKKHVQQMKQKGYSPVIQTLPRFSERYWLVLPEQNLEQLSSAFWGDIGRLSSGIKRSTIASCDSHAPSQ